MSAEELLLYILQGEFAVLVLIIFWLKRSRK